jgi:hypothetical protein
MESKTQNQEPMSQMNPGMGQMPMNNLPNYQYFIPDYHAMQNYPQMALYANRQQMNGYPYQMEQPREEQAYPQSPAQKVQNNQKISSANQPTTEKQKIKPYINLLINTVENLFKEGKISTKYLNEKTEHKSNHSNIAATNSMGNSTNRKISETSSLNNTNSIKKTNNTKKQTNVNMIYHSHINDQNHLKTNHKGDCCENCEDVFNSNKDKYRTKIRGQKIQEKNLCKSCFEAVEKGNFCYYCSSIYRDGLLDTAKWVECDYCHGWEHFYCEIQKGKKYAGVQELNDEKHYMCPICVNKRNSQKNIDNKIQKKLINKKRRGDVFDDQKNKKNQRKDLRNLKSEKCSELLEDIELMEKLAK